ncbi:MAG: carbohydrate binding domain-containing protein [Sedimentisphaerales bacterium]|nr:carbohydrate binding domain-containing protein [Sedimentisphaerales bacterium]
MKRKDVVLILMFLLLGTSTVNAQEIVNLFDNPGFEEGTGIDVQEITGWRLYTQESATGLLSIDTQEAIEGGQCVFIEVTGVPAGGSWNLRFDHTRRFSVEQGTTYTMSFWLKGDPGPVTLSASRAEQNEAGQWGALAQQVVNPTEEWVEYYLTFESSEDRLIMWQILISNEGQTYYVDHARCYEGEYVPDRIGPLTQAYDPVPEDGALYPDTWANLSWKPGDKAVSHDVYFSDNFDLVQDGAAEAFRGNQGADFFIVGFPGFPYPDGLVPGTTYYWRIDEVNDADPNSPWKGPVWSFSIPPKTAYDPNPADGTGLTNTTVILRWTPGFGAKTHMVYLGDDFDQVNNATVGVPTGAAFYSPGSLEREKVYYWRVDEFDGLGTYKGDVWTFTTPGTVGNPQPVNGATDVAMATILNWTAADNAASHEVYFGLDKDTVRGADTGSPEYKGPKGLGAENYDPGLLNLGTTYYWRVDEVYNGATVKGPVWSFTVGDFLMVDDFESYTDDDASGQAIWQHWIDGFGVPGNGAQVGYLVPPYAEQTIVHGGDQSMPLLYFNEAGVTNSQAALTLTALRDWTVAGVGELSLWIRGDSANAADPLYVALSNTAGAPAVVAHDDPSASTNPAWRQWRIVLQFFADQGINLTNVDQLAIGLGSKGGAAAGGTGTMYIDDIRLYRAAP